MCVSSRLRAVCSLVLLLRDARAFCVSDRFGSAHFDSIQEFKRALGKRKRNLHTGSHAKLVQIVHNLSEKGPCWNPQGFCTSPGRTASRAETGILRTRKDLAEKSWKGILFTHFQTRESPFRKDLVQVLLRERLQSSSLGISHQSSWEGTFKDLVKKSCTFSHVISCRPFTQGFSTNPAQTRDLVRIPLRELCKFSDRISYRALAKALVPPLKKK